MSPPRRKVVAVWVAVGMAVSSVLRFDARPAVEDAEDFHWRKFKFWANDFWMKLCRRSCATRRESAGASVRRAQADSTPRPARDIGARSRLRDGCAAPVPQDRAAAA